jgi:hypothetical protein
MTPVIVADHILAVETGLIFALLWTIFFVLNFSFEFKLLNFLCQMLIIDQIKI